MNKKLSTLFAVVAISAIGLAAPPEAKASTCFQVYQRTVEDCGAWAVACNLDAAVDLTACVRSEVFG